MSQGLENYKNDEFAAFIKELIRKDIREMVRTEIVSLSRDLPPTTLEAVILQQMIDKMKKQDEAIGDLREEVRAGFRRTDERFDQVDQRFEQVDQRFEQVDQRFEQVDQRFEQVNQNIGDIKRNFDDLKSWVGVVVGRFQNRAGKSLEDMAAGTLRLALKRKDIDPSSIKLRQKIADAEGIIGPKGRVYEVDILAEGNSLLVFEVKSYCDLEMAERFADKVMLMRHLYSDKLTDAALIVLEPAAEILEYCRNLMISVVN